MRKVIKRPDGTEEVVEGTAEEIAEYERQIREGNQPKPKKKPILRGAEVDGQPLTDGEITLIRLSRAGLLPKEKEPVYVPYQILPPYTWNDNKVTAANPACIVCGKFNCTDFHVWCGTLSFDALAGTTTLSEREYPVEIEGRFLPLE